MVTVKRVASSKKAARSVKTDSDELTLPTEAVETATEFSEFCSVFFGDKAVGKTTLLSMFPDVFTFQLEPGRRHVKTRQVPKKGEVLDWLKVKGYLMLALEDDSVKTVGIDTIDKAYDLCFRYKCQEAGCNHPQDLGRDGQYLWNAIYDEFSDTFNLIKNYGKTPVFLSHGKDHEHANVLRNTKVSKYSPSCTGQALKYLQSVADFVFCYTRDGEQRVLLLQGHENVWAACGPEDCFKDKKTGEPLRAISMDGGASQAYRNLLDGFANKLTELVLSDDHEEPPTEPEKKSPKKVVIKKKGT